MANSFTDIRPRTGLIVASGLIFFDDSPRGPQGDKSIKTQKPYGWMPPGCQGAFCLHPKPEDTLRVNSELPRQVAAEAPRPGKCCETYTKSSLGWMPVSDFKWRVGDEYFNFI